jgi:hypothetical protein
MARSFSPMLIGKVIEGIWHTCLVVYGKEYFYGGGICVAPPKVKINFIFKNLILFLDFSIWTTRERNAHGRDRNSRRII